VTGLKEKGAADSDERVWSTKAHCSGGETEQLLRALNVKLNELALADDQREVMRALNGVMVVRVLRQAGSAMTIRDVAARTCLPVYEAEAALDSLCENGAAERDTTGRAWTYRAIERPPSSVESASSSRDKASVAGGSSAQDGSSIPQRGRNKARGDELTPASALVAALRVFKIVAEVKGHGVMVAATTGPSLRVASARSAEGTWVWSWRHGGREHRHPRSDPDGAAWEIATCLATEVVSGSPSGRG
jgi:hypothetical protein